MDNSKVKNNTKEDTNTKSSDNKKAKSKFHLLRIGILVITMCLVVFGTIIVSDLLSDNNDINESAENRDNFITIQVSGSSVFLDGEQVTPEELRLYLQKESAKGNSPMPAFVNDSLNPADYLVFNQVLDILSEFGINTDVERMSPPATTDEISVSTNDEM